MSSNPVVPAVGRAAVAELLAGLDLAVRDLGFIAKASTCEVWRAETAAGPVAVRILAPRPGKRADLAADAALRGLLLGRGARVAIPLADHSRRPDLVLAPQAPAWAVDAWLDGEPAGPGTAAGVWHDLGILLAVLHALPVRGHGRLRIAGDGVEGRLPAPERAVEDRFERPWPFDGTRLPDHPLTGMAPETAGRLRLLEDRIRAAAASGPTVVHGDLNGANIRHRNGRLSGLLDLTDAAVLAPAWDFALLQHFHGAEAVAATLAGYATGRDTATLAHDARLLALVVALHHLSRAATLDLSARRAFALDRLRRGLDAIEAG